ncbi:hypothetical protein CALVIDRAFT_598637 [Calocera viscosa TUFC12733]|uniref:Uncharacterized protein n=1 Tax=Calocera viscosa (strain TUFC12733) TaxID=1330018 RepID=A0A167LQX4_CALVF|nr:hypothetical protein CALVIDRAFT_598637 [Calocera viscosa TUFC12733]
MVPVDQVLGKRKQQPEVSSSSGLLEVEDDDARETRLGRLLAETASEDAQQSAGGRKSRGGGRNGEQDLPLRLGRLNEPVPMPGTASNLLARLDAFLPSLKASNQALLDQAARDPESVDIEHLTPGEEGVEPEHIEMNLGLGVFTLKKDAATPDPSAGEDHDTDDSDDAEPGDESTESENSPDDESTSSSGRESDGSTEGFVEDSRSSTDRGQASDDADGGAFPRLVPHRPPAGRRVSP